MQEMIIQMQQQDSKENSGSKKHSCDNEDCECEEECDECECGHEHNK